LRAKVFDQASALINYDLPVYLFPGILLRQLATYPATKLPHYLYIQVGKSPAQGRVIFSPSGLSGGGQDTPNNHPGFK
jgi:hypothetical protein